MLHRSRSSGRSDGGATVRIETYYKRLSNLLIGRLETEAERLARLAEYRFPRGNRIESAGRSAHHHGSRPMTAAAAPTAPTSLLSRMTAPVDAKVRGWISYTWGKSRARRVRPDVTIRIRPRTCRGRGAVVSHVAEVGALVDQPLGHRVSAHRADRRSDRRRGTPRRRRHGDRAEARSSVIRVYEVNFGGVSNLNNARLPYFARTDVRVIMETARCDAAAGSSMSKRSTRSTGRTPTRSRRNWSTTGHRTGRRITERPAEGITMFPTMGVRWRF